MLVALASLLCTGSHLLEGAYVRSQAMLADARAAGGSHAGLLPRLEAASRRRERRQRLDVIQRLEWMTYDWRMRRLAQVDTRATPDLGLVLADNSTVERLALGLVIPGENWDLFWPRWPVYGRLLRELRVQGARAVAFDILMTDRRFSEDGLLRRGPDGEPEVYSSDREFARELSAEGAPAFLAVEPDALPMPLFHAAVAGVGDVSSPKDSDGVARRVRAFTDFQWIHPELGRLADVWGVNLEVTPDDTVRIVDPRTGTEHLFEPDEEGMVSLPFRWDRPGLAVKRRTAVRQKQRVWHLGIVVAAQHLGLDLDAAKMTPEGLVIPGTNGTVRRLPVDPHGYLPLQWGLEINQTTRFPQRNLADVLGESVARGTNPPPVGGPWQDRVVVVGSTASGNNLADRGATPLDNSDYLVTTYLNVARMVIEDQFIEDLPFRVRLLMVACLAALSATLAWKLRAHVAPWWIAAVGVGWVALAVWMFTALRIWIPMAHPLVGGLLLPFAGMVTYRVFFEQREQQRIRGIFARMVSPNIVQEVLESRNVALGGARREITVLFADIRGFSALTDRRQRAAEETVRRLGLVGAAADAHYEIEARKVLDTVNLYLAAIADVVKLRQGTLDKYIGDCVMAFWGAPTDNPLHAVHAVEAGMEIQRAVARLNLQRAGSDGVEVGTGDALLQVGTGINTGLVTVGLMGSEAHIVNYTAFGREVNLASRLEGVAGHARVVIGTNTFLHLERHAPELAARCRALERVQVKGFQEPVPIYEVLWREPVSEPGTGSQ